MFGSVIGEPFSGRRQGGAAYDHASPGTLGSDSASRGARHVLHEGVLVQDDPAHRELDQKSDLVGLEHRDTVDRRGVGRLDTDTVGEAVADLRPVATDTTNAGVLSSGVTGTARDGAAVGNRQPEQSVHARSQVDGRLVGGVTSSVARGDQDRTELRVERKPVEVVLASSHHLVPGQQVRSGVFVGAELNLVGRVSDEAAVTDVEGLAGGSVPAVQNSQVKTTGSRSRQLIDDPVVHTVDVGPSELLGHGDDGSELLRGDRANAVAQLADRLRLSLGHRLDLGLSGAVQERGLAIAHRNRVASQTRNNALVLGGLVNHGNKLARQASEGRSAKVAIVSFILCYHLELRTNCASIAPGVLATTSPSPRPWVGSTARAGLLETPKSPLTFSAWARISSSVLPLRRSANSEADSPGIPTERAAFKRMCSRRTFSRSAAIAAFSSESCASCFSNSAETSWRALSKASFAWTRYLAASLFAFVSFSRAHSGRASSF